MSTQEGGCMCGAIRYTVEGEPVGKALCHCLDCRKITGSTYSTNGIYPEDKFKITKGTAKEYRKTADSGKSVISHFCGDCGSTIWRDGDSFQGVKVVKVGTLDAPDALTNIKPGAELFVGERVPWVAAIEGAAQKEGMP